MWPGAQLVMTGQSLEPKCTKYFYSCVPRGAQRSKTGTNPCAVHILALACWRYRGAPPDYVEDKSAVDGAGSLGGFLGPMVFGSENLPFYLTSFYVEA